MMTIAQTEVMLTPADFTALSERDLRRSVCVVFDVLRATTSMLTALGNGAEAVVPVKDIADALALRAQRPDVLLAGERQGVRIAAELTGGIEFDLGNSPREFTRDTVCGRTIVITTTNGTRALRACVGAQTVLVSSFLNLQATGNWIRGQLPEHLILVCSGTFEQAALEDTLAAGALLEALWAHCVNGQVADTAVMARQLYCRMQDDLPGALEQARNGRRLLANPELRGDVPFALQRDLLPFAARLGADGVVRRWPDEDSGRDRIVPAP